MDLAKISTGKDAVIEGHRDEIRRLKDRVAELEKYHIFYSNCKRTSGALLKPRDVHPTMR